MVFTQTGHQGRRGGWGSDEGGSECQAKERGLHGVGTGEPSMEFEQGSDQEARSQGVRRRTEAGCGDQERWRRAGPQGPQEEGVKGAGTIAQGARTMSPGLSTNRYRGERCADREAQ